MTIRESDLGEGDAGAHYGQCPSLIDATSAAKRDTVRSLSVVALAGAEVDRRLTGNAFTSGSGDYDAVRQLLFSAFFDGEIDELVAAVSPDEAQIRGLDEIASEGAEVIEDHLKRLVDELRNEAHQLIESKWHHVEGVAEALLKSGVLEGDQVRQIIRSGEQSGRPE